VSLTAYREVMTTQPVAAGVTRQQWVDAVVGEDHWLEIVGGEFVVRRVGGNLHHYLASRLALAFEDQWGAVACAPGNWALRESGGVIDVGRIPDVLVDGPQLLREPVYAGVPEAAAEVWSPSNTLAEMNAKRQDYRQAGLPVLVEASLTDAGEVHLEWYVNAGDRWELEAVAVGERPLVVERPRPFTVVPDRLLRSPR